MEYMAGGTLLNFLHENHKHATNAYVNVRPAPGDHTARLAHPLTAELLTSFGYQVARGMEYLASIGVREENFFFFL